MAVTEVAPRSKLNGHHSSVSTLCWPTAALLYSGSWDGTIREWDVETASVTATLGGQPAATSVDVSLGASLIASGHTDHVLRLWDARLQQAALRLKLPHKGGWVSGVCWNPQQPQLLASSCYDGVVRLWDVRTTIPLHTLAKHDGKALCVAWDGAEHVASGGADAALRITAVHLV